MLILFKCENVTCMLVGTYIMALFINVHEVLPNGIKA